MFIFPPIKGRQYSVMYFLNFACVYKNHFFMLWDTWIYPKRAICVEASKVVSLKNEHKNQWRGQKTFRLVSFHQILSPNKAYVFHVYDLILNYSYRQWLRPGHSFMRWSRSISANFESHSNGDRWWVYHQRRHGWANRWCCLWCNWQWISNLRQSPYI